MMIKPSQQANGLNDAGPFAAKSPVARPIGADHRAPHGQTAPGNDTPGRVRHPAETAPGIPDLSMDYQQGFFSGSSS